MSNITVTENQNSVHQDNSLWIYDANDLGWVVDQSVILENISFKIKQGEFVGFVGPNGAGKSSLLRCLFGKNEITTGSLHYKNQPLNHYSRREIAQQVAVLVQEPPTQFDMTVFDLVSLGLIPHRGLFSFNSEQDKRTINEAIEEVELSHKSLEAFNTLSGGEKQRVMVARAIVQKPQILILDEPTNHLDIQHQIDVLKLAKEMNITVLLSIHDLNMASGFCDRLILMDKGKIVTDGAPEIVLTQQNLKQVFNIQVEIDQHPFHLGNRITFDFIGQPSTKKVQQKIDHSARMQRADNEK